MILVAFVIKNKSQTKTLALLKNVLDEAKNHISLDRDSEGAYLSYFVQKHSIYKGRVSGTISAVVAVLRWTSYLFHETTSSLERKTDNLYLFRSEKLTNICSTMNKAASLVWAAGGGAMYCHLTGNK